MKIENYNEVCVKYMKVRTLIRGHFNNNVPIEFQGQLDKLKKILKGLGESYSPMAERNFLNDMLRVLVKIEQQHKTRPNIVEACVDAKNTIARFIKGCNVTNAKYTNVVCLGYRVKTAGPTYSGKTDDRNDMEAKCETLKEAIRSAYTLASPYNANDKILKVFMAPEFYFRGRNGAYDHALVDGVAATSSGGAAQRGLMDLMAEELEKDIYSDWLFVLGTAIAATRETHTVCDCGGRLEYVRDRRTNKMIVHPGTKKTMTVCTVDPAHTKTKEIVRGARVDNVAYVWKEKETHTIAKELISNVDYDMDRDQGKKRLVKLQGEDQHVLREADWSADSQPSKFQDERMGGSIFTIDGITFGLEICLDHTATAKDTPQGRLENAANIQVQLIPSAGMSIKQFRVLDGGVIFNVDGSTPRVEVRGTRPAAGANPAVLEWRKNFFDGEVSRNQDKNADSMGKWNQAEDANWSNSKNKAAGLASGADGSVLMYGPYIIPSTLPPPA